MSSAQHWALEEHLPSAPWGAGKWAIVTHASSIFDEIGDEGIELAEGDLLRLNYGLPSRLWRGVRASDGAEGCAHAPAAYTLDLC